MQQYSLFYYLILYLLSFGDTILAYNKPKVQNNFLKEKFKKEDSNE